ncbi:MAG: type II toxin-antitoxin system ParD family antitoxin [Verrucomicrobiales bacterium]
MPNQLTGKSETADFQSVDEVIGAGIKLLNDSNEKLNSLRAALIAGESESAIGAFDVETFIRTARTSR